MTIWNGYSGPIITRVKRVYFAELGVKPEAWRPLLEAAWKGTATLLFSARDDEHNNAVALGKTSCFGPKGQTPRRKSWT